MAMVERARSLARDTGTLNRFVFFNDTWVPYDRRADYLLEADVGVSTHFDHLETRFSFRTRILDYFWAGLPVLCTAGDSLGDTVERKDLGLTVAPEDVGAAAAAIEQLLADPSQREAQAMRVRAHAQSMTWEMAARPLVRYCERLGRAADLASLPERTGAMRFELRSDLERAALAHGWPPPRRNLASRVARVLRLEGPMGVARRIAHRAGGQRIT